MPLGDTRMVVPEADRNISASAPPSAGWLSRKKTPWLAGRRQLMLSVASNRLLAVSGEGHCPKGRVCFMVCFLECESVNLHPYISVYVVERTSWRRPQAAPRQRHGDARHTEQRGQPQAQVNAAFQLRILLGGN